MSKGSKIVSSSIIGTDFVNVMIHYKVYSIFPPAIYKLAGVGAFLSDFGDEQTLRDIVESVHHASNLARALSWLMNGDESLYDELSQGTFEELVDALCQVYSLISVESFTRLSILAKNVSMLIANQK